MSMYEVLKYQNEVLRRPTSNEVTHIPNVVPINTQTPQNIVVIIIVIQRKLLGTSRFCEVAGHFSFLCGTLFVVHVV